MIMRKSERELWSHVLAELASELDLHYEDDDFFALRQVIGQMKPLVEILRSHEIPVPSVVTHVLNRFNRTCN